MEQMRFITSPTQRVQMSFFSFIQGFDTDINHYYDYETDNTSEMAEMLIQNSNEFQTHQDQLKSNFDIEVE